MSILYQVIIGLAAGWLAGYFTQGKGFGWVGNLIIGVVGAIIGGIVFSLLGLSPTNLLGQLISATVGALILLVIVGIVAKSNRGK